MTGQENIEQDDLFIVSKGAYSDYNLLTACRALRDIDVLKEFAAYGEDVGRNAKYLSPHSFIKWLIVDAQAAEEIDIKEWWLGDPYDGIANAKTYVETLSTVTELSSPSETRMSSRDDSSSRST